MFLVGLISWWYGRGWIGQWQRVGSRLRSTLDFFSVGQLMSTLFSPFRQISAGASADSGFGSAMRAMVDQLISRCIGAFIRFFTIIVGLLAITFQFVYEVLIMIIWWFLPILPVLGFILVAIGWVPSWI